MAVLSRSKIASLLTTDIEEFKTSLTQGKRQILVSPFDEKELGPSSYDLHLGPKYISLRGKATIIEIGEGPVSVGPGESFAVVSNEYIGLPHDVAGMIYPRASWLERGLSQISSYVHPGFHGHVAETLTNLTDGSLEIEAGTAFCQIAFVEVPGATVNERYQGDRLGQTVEMLMEKLAEEHQNPRRVEGLRIMPLERKTFRGFIGYLFGLRRIEGSKTEIERLAQSSRWKMLGEYYRK